MGLKKFGAVYSAYATRIHRSRPVNTRANERASADFVESFWTRRLDLARTWKTPARGPPAFARPSTQPGLPKTDDRQGSTLTGHPFGLFTATPPPTRYPLHSPSTPRHTYLGIGPKIQMSTLPPNRHHHREELMRASQVNMAVAQPTKAKSASKAAAATTTNNSNNNNSSGNATSKQKSQMHRRSRTGLYKPFPSLLFLLLLSLLDLHRRCPPLHRLCQMHASSFSLHQWLVYLYLSSYPRPHQLTWLCFKAATHAGCEGRSATKARPCARLANISASPASTSAQCGGATTMRGESTRTTSR